MLILELMISGWSTKYNKIIQEFGYKKPEDMKAAYTLNSILQKQFSIPKLRKMIFGRSVFVVGSGPSLKAALPTLKEYKNTIKICADTALAPLMKNGITPQIIVTDLDGDLDLLGKISRTSLIIVHAHGDNISKLEFAKNFKNCIGTTQTKEIGKMLNFGGFTDGDRCVFLASYFEAAKIFLFGMDFGPKIGTYSNTKKSERRTKLKKLQYGKMLLEWLAPKTKSDLYTLSKPLRGFEKITFRELEHNICS
ncbi:MAG: 6-hydroxymethylpterin diphosphokinase MptE-like protein [Candidatus Nitrosotenuis sp.]